MSDLTSAPPTLKLPHSSAAGEAPALVGERLQGTVQPVAALTTHEREQMFQLLNAYFQQVSRPAFERDLSEKESAILLFDRASGALRGFSTLMRMQASVDGAPIVAFFSGDTIIQREYWGEPLLPSLWSRHVFAQAALVSGPVYWFLICSGYKTYRFLPLFFKEFYPRYERPTPPAMRRVLDALALHKFGPGYNPERGVVRLGNATPLRQGVADITEQRLRDPHVAFFLQANTGHTHGDELACLTLLDPDNLTRAGRRMVGL